MKKEVICVLTATGLLLINQKAAYADTFGERMSRAGLNTLMGMGTVFIVLIFISLIISCFKFIPRLQAAFNKKDKQQASLTEEKKELTNAPVVKEEPKELVDDLELVAVIAAAIAASLEVSTEDFIVRSIKRIPNWK